MQLFYSQEIDQTMDTFTFDKDESKHIVRVLRKKIGDTLYVTNGKGQLFTTMITLDSDKRCVTTIQSCETKQRNNFSIHLAVAPTKQNERYEWFLEKATEIGIDRITPIICEHSERKIVKTDRFEKIVHAAMKQSLSCYLPQLDQPITLKEFLSQDHKAELYIAHCEEDQQKILLKDRIEVAKNYLLLVGPEGDFSPKEIALAYQKGFIPVALGHTRLRTETAAIVATHSFVFANE